MPALALTRGINCTVNRTFPLHSLFSHGEYEDHSSTAHFVLGVGLMLLVCVWTLHLCSCTFLWRLRSAYISSGLVQFFMGLYLFVWVFVLVKPSHASMGQVMAFSFKDVVQIQHIALAVLLMGAGMVELSHGLRCVRRDGGDFLETNRGGRTTTRRAMGRGAPDCGGRNTDGCALDKGSSVQNWHMLGTVNTVFAGLIFLVHPQHDEYASFIHVMLGATLVLASIFFWEEKRRGFPASLDESSSVIMAGGLFLIAGFFLVFFHEEPTDKEFGRTLWCHPSWPLVVAALTTGSVTLAAGSLVALPIKWTAPLVLPCIRCWEERKGREGVVEEEEEEEEEGWGRRGIGGGRVRRGGDSGGGGGSGSGVLYRPVCVRSASEDRKDAEVEEGSAVAVDNAVTVAGAGGGVGGVGLELSFVDGGHGLNEETTDDG